MKRLCLFPAFLVGTAVILAGGLFPSAAQDAIEIEIEGGEGGAIQIRGNGVAIGAAKVVVKAAAATKKKEDGEKEEGEEKPRFEFPPDLEKALDELIEKSQDARKEQAKKEIEEEIERIADFHQLEEDKVEKLKELSSEAVDASMEPWGKEVKEYFREEVGDELEDEDEVTEEELKEVIEEISEAEPEEVVKEMPAGVSRPEMQPEWETALKKVLSEEQVVAWKQEKEDEKKRIEQQFAKLVDMTADNYKRQYGAQMDPLVEDILATVKLDEKRGERLKEASEKAIQAFLGEWRKKAHDYIDEAEESRREAMLKRGYISIGVDTDSLPAKQQSWTDSLEEILSKEEKKIWDKALADRETRRERAATKMLLAAIDELMALTAEQREKLQPLLVKEAIDPMTTQLKRDYWGSMNVTRIVQNAKAVDQKKVEAILDEDQWQRWQAAVNPVSKSSSKAKKGEIKKGVPSRDPVAMEKAITAHLYRLMLSEREKILSNVLIQAEDAGRVVDLSPEARRRLQTAAKGAAEAEVETWSSSMSSWLRRSIQGATPANIDQRLRNLGGVRFGRSKRATQSPIWTTAVETLLTDAQRETWQVEVEARKDFRREATAALIMTQLDNAARLTRDQVGEIEPLLEEAIADYGPDIDRYFSSWSNDTPWYLNSYYNMIPFQGIPEKRAKAILSKAQWKIWEERFHSRVSHYWDQVIDYHEQRMKKEEAARKKEEEEEEKKDGKEAAEEPAEETVKES